MDCSLSGERNNDVNIELRQIVTALWNYKTHTSKKASKINTTRYDAERSGQNKRKGWTQNMRFSR